MDRLSSKDFNREFGGLKNLDKLDKFVTGDIKTSRQDKKGFFKFGKETVSIQNDREFRTKHIGKILQQDFKEAKTDDQKRMIAGIAQKLRDSESKVEGPKKQNKERIKGLDDIIARAPKAPKHTTFKEPIATEIIPRKTRVPEEGKTSRSREEEPVTTTKEKHKLPEKPEYTKSGYLRGPSASEKRIERMLDRSSSSDSEEAPVIKPDVLEILPEESRPRRERIAASLSKHLVMPDKISEEELSRLMPRASLNDPRYLDRAEKKIEIIKKKLEGFHTPTKLVIPKDEDSRRKFVQTLFSPEFVDLDISFITSRIGLHQIQIDIK